MKKYFWIIIFSFFVFSSSVFAWEVDTKSENILLYNLKENKIIYEQNSTDNTKIASLTKIVTVLVALENIEDFNKKVTLTPEVFTGLEEADASVAGFQVEEVVTYEDLLYGALLPSGADATRALAINLFGSEKNFVNKMNDLMTKLKITNTHFTNTSGLDEEGQKATLKDLLTIILYAFKNDRFVEIFSAKSYTTDSGRLNLRSTLSSYNNKYNLDTSIIVGSKTGYTNQAGLCLISYTKKNDLELLLITTKAPIVNDRYPYNVTDALAVYNYYFDNYGYQRLVKKNQIITSVKTKYSKNKKAQVIYKENDFLYFLPNNYDDDFRYDFNIKDYVSFKTNENKPVGKITLYYQETKIFDGDLYLSQKINFSIVEFIIYYRYPFLISTVIVIIIIYKKRKSSKKRKRK